MCIRDRCVCIRRTRPSLNIFCPWSCEEERGSHLFCKDILDVPFQLFCQTGTRTTAGDPWLCKLLRKKHELPVNTPSPNTHRLLVLQILPLHSERQIKWYIYIYIYIFFFLIVPPQYNYYSPLLHFCHFLYSLNKKGTGKDNLFSNVSEVPAKTSKSRKIHNAAGRRFWQFLLVNQLPLSIMAVHAKYRATAPLSHASFLNHGRQSEVWDFLLSLFILLSVLSLVETISLKIFRFWSTAWQNFEQQRRFVWKSSAFESVFA